MLTSLLSSLPFFPNNKILLRFGIIHSHWLTCELSTLFFFSCMFYAYMCILNAQKCTHTYTHLEKGRSFVWKKKEKQKGKETAIGGSTVKALDTLKNETL